MPNLVNKVKSIVGSYVPIDSYMSVFQPVVLAEACKLDASDLIRMATEVTISDTIKKASEVIISLNVKNNDVNFDTILSDKRLQPGAEWKIMYGYIDEVSKPLIAQVTYFEPSFEENGDVKVVIHANSLEMSINKGSKSTNWGKVDTSEIAKKIAKRHGLKSKVEASKDKRDKDYVQSAGVSDMRYLSDLASNIGFVTYVDGTVLIYRKPRRDTSPVMEFTWFGSDKSSLMQSFKPKIKEKPADEQGSEGPNDDDNKQNKDKAKDEKKDPGINVDLENKLYFDMPVNVIPTVETSKKINKKMAEAKQLGMLDKVNEATLECIGLPKLKKDINVKVTGIAPQLCGIWHVKELTHKVSGKYMTTLELGRQTSKKVKKKLDVIDNKDNEVQEQGSPKALCRDMNGQSHFDGEACVQ